MSRVTVVGAGFAALTAVRTLRAADASVQIDLVAPKPEFVYYPGTIWIPTGLRQPADLVVPLDNFFRRMNVNYHQASAQGLRDGGRVVITDQGELGNDGLIIACGGRFIRKLPGIEHSFLPCGGVEVTAQIRDRLAQLEGGTLAFGFSGNPNEPSAMRGGPVFEFLFGIESWLRRNGRRDGFRIVFFTPAEKPGQRLGPKAVEGLMREMSKRGIETHLGHKLKQFEADKVVTEGGEFAADMILFMPGMTGNQWFDDTELPRSPGGMIKADQYCQVEGWDKVYVAGDSGSFPGPEWLPKQAHMADLQAAAAVNNLMDAFAGRAASHTFRAELVCIVDTRSSGMLVARTAKRNIVLPSFIGFHWAKRLFEWNYLRQYR
ncbi:MAG: FAD-dependent oxidoreductase [Gammaproteobacteria bacterium]|nr:FAD-dependent oxidoreductase [Gammaproteobacteria bacterium]MCP5298839.1 FAD-dependent oxidoreductase [Chromatiaceae bacterium]